MGHSSYLMLALLSVAPSAAVAQGAPARAARPQNTVPYTINAGDEIEVYVWGEERLQRVVRVLPDGTIAVPLVGQLTAQGLLPEQLENIISQRLAPQFRNQVPQVTVSVRSPSGMQFSVIGRVKSAGTFTPGRYVNVLEAISLAGGPAEFADLNDIAIVRKTPTGLTTVRARLASVLKNGVPPSGGEAAVPRIQSGDTIIVP